MRRVAVPGQKLRVAEREGKKTTDKRRSEHEKDYSNKLAARHRFSRWVHASSDMGGRLSVH